MERFVIDSSDMDPRATAALIRRRLASDGMRFPSTDT